MTKRVLLFFLLSVFIHSFSDAQVRWVQIFVDGLQNESDCRALEAELKSHEGIQMVRAESHDGNLLVFVSSDYLYSEAQFMEWLQSFGLHGWCYRTGIQGIETIKRIARSECSGQEQK